MSPFRCLISHPGEAAIWLGRLRADLRIVPLCGHQYQVNRAQWHPICQAEMMPLAKPWYYSTGNVSTCQGGCQWVVSC